MADIPLRTYVQQLDNLIERHQVEEAIAHCRHILSLYPKHLDTYRMLGKALLEKGRHGDAADIFQRVLSVMPDDFISHVGMSIVREDEANLDAALWHMERAFEAAPANGAIQQELCRLYGRRDGVIPTKARLTRGALARMYAQGGLYLQAEAELKAALVAEADRIDLLTKLAEVYWQTDQPAQAAQTSAAILQKLPYSLEANRILVNIFRAQGRAADAAVYRQRLEALDPYEAFVDPAANGAGAARVDPAKVALARLDYTPGMEDSGSPDWLTSIGAKFEEPPSARAPEAQPDWLSGSADTAPSLPAADYQPGQSGVPDWLKDLDGGPASAPAAPTSAQPDWLKDIGNVPQTPGSGTSDEALPDWLVSTTGPLPADAVPNWMLPGSAATESEDHVTGPLTAPSPSDFPTGPASGPQPLEPSLAPIVVPLEPTSEVPDWLKTTAPDDSDEELPDWLKAITAQPAAPAPTMVGELPGLASDQQVSVSPDAATAPVSPAATTLAPAEPVAQAAPTESQTGPLPDWLQAATDEMDQAQTAGQLTAEPASPEPVASVVAAPAQPATPPEGPTVVQPAETAEPIALGTLPDWLKDLAAPAEAVAGATALALTQPAAADDTALVTDTAPAAPTTSAIESNPDLPDWLKAAAPAEAQAISLAASDSTDARPVMEGDDLPEWLQTATAAPARNEPPAWLQTAPAGPSLIEPPAEPETPLEMPDWLKDVSASAPPADTGPLAPVELPDYLQLASPAAIARAEQPLELEPEVTEPEEDEPVLALPAEIPDWLKALAPITPDPVLPAEPPAVPLAAEASLSEYSLSWMDELTSPAAATGTATAGEALPDELPAWLATPAADAPTEATSSDTAAILASGLGDDTLAAEIPPWAQNDEPGPSDTIASWLAGKHVPDWLRQPTNEAPSLPAVEWEPDQAELAMPTTTADSLASSAALPETAPSGQPAPAAELAPAVAPDLAALDADDAFRWLESLAAQQGANPEELFTAPAVAVAQVEFTLPAAEPAPQAMEPVALAAETASPVVEPPAPAPVEPIAAGLEAPVAEPVGLEAFLRQTEAALPADHLLDTAPSKPKTSAQNAPVPAPATPPAVEPAPPSAASAPVDEPGLGELDGEAALRWLEGLAAQQGAKSEELLTAPEDRTLEAPQWVAAEMAAAEPVPAPAAPPSDEAAVAATPAEIQSVAEEAVAAAVAEVPAAAVAPELTAAPEPIAAAAPAALETEAPLAELASASALVTPPDSADAGAEAGTVRAAAEWVSAAEPVAATPTVEHPAAENLAALVPAIETPAEPAAQGLSPDAEAEAAMRWLEGLAAQHGAKPEELLTAPEDRTAEAPAWITAAAQSAAAESTAAASVSPFEAVTPTSAPLAEPEPEPEPAAPEPEPAAAPETPEWLRTVAPLEAQVDTPVVAPEPAAPAPSPAPLAASPDADLDKLSRLAERLGAARRAREVEMEARFAEQRNQQEAARRLVEDRLKAKRTEPEPSPSEAAATTTAAEVPPAAADVPALAPAEPVVHPRPRPAIRLHHPQPTPTVAPPVSQPTAAPAAIPAAATEALARGQAALSGQDYQAAVTHLSVLVEQGHHLDTVVQSLETAAQAGPAPAPVLRLLGDAYMRTDQLQKALDTYRQALRRL